MLGWFWLQGRLSPGWGLVLASSLTWSEMADIRPGRVRLAHWPTGWRPLQPSPWCCSTSARREEMVRTVGRELGSSVGSRVEEEGDQAVDSKPGGRVVLPRLSININNPSHRTPHHTTTLHYTTLHSAQWHISETTQSPNNTIYNIWDFIYNFLQFLLEQSPLQGSSKIIDFPIEQIVKRTFQGCLYLSSAFSQFSRTSTST